MGGSTLVVSDQTGPSRRSRRNVARGVVFVLFASLLSISLQPPTPAPAAQSDDQWVLTETLVNPDNHPTEFVVGVTPDYYESPRFDGKYQRYTVTATGFSSQNRDVDRGVESWNVSSSTTFDSPPPVLIPGDVVALQASGSMSGSAVDSYNPGEQFEFRADGATLEGETYFSMGINPEGGPTSGSVSPQFTAPTPWGETAEIQIHAFYWNCGACLVTWVYQPQIAPPPTTAPSTTTAPTTTRPPEPLACHIRGRVADGGWRQFGPRDEDGHPLIGVQVSVTPQGAFNQMVIAASDADGYYDILILSEDLPAGFDSENDEVQVMLSLKEAAHDPPRFMVGFNSTYLTELRTDPFVLGDECGTAGLVERDFLLGAIPDEYEAVTPDRKEDWDDIGEIYHRIHNATLLADLLHQPLDYGSPLTIVTFASGFEYTADDEAYWCGALSDGYDCTEDSLFAGSVYLAFGDSATLLSDPEWPDNREYHEFGHHFMADAFANAMPASAGNINHGGYYENPSSTDSWVEGFAEFFSVMVSKHIDQDPVPEIYVDRYDFELDFRPWFAQGADEELAIAGLLLDLEDGPDDYAQGRFLPELVVDWYDTYPDPALGTILVGEVVNGSEYEFDYSEQTMVAAEFRQGGAVTHTGWAKTTPWDLPGGGSRGFFAVVVPPDLAWDRVDLAVFEGRPGDIGNDDDPVDLTLQEVWDTIVLYPSVQPESNGYLFDVADLYDAFSAAYGGSDADGNGMDDIDQVFVAHGFFADRDGDRSFHSETPGMTDHPAQSGFPDAIPRRGLPPLPGTLMTVDTGQVESRVVVQTLLPDMPGYSYVASRDAAGKVHVAVPGVEGGGTVMLGVVAPGYQPTIAGAIDIETFWADVEARGNDAAPTFTVDLVPEKDAGVLGSGVWPLVLGGGGLLLILAAILGWLTVRRRPGTDT